MNFQEILSQKVNFQQIMSFYEYSKNQLGSILEIVSRNFKNHHIGLFSDENAYKTIISSKVQFLDDIEPKHYHFREKRETKFTNKEIFTIFLYRTLDMTIIPLFSLSADIFLSGLILF